MMPGMTGMDVYATLRQKSDAHAARMVFMTGGAFVPRRVAEFLDIAEPEAGEALRSGQRSRAALRAISSGSRAPNESATPASEIAL